jgi:hypothetical protein
MRAVVSARATKLAPMGAHPRLPNPKPAGNLRSIRPLLARSNHEPVVSLALVVELGAQLSHESRRLAERF